MNRWESSLYAHQLNICESLGHDLIVMVRKTFSQPPKPQRKQSIDYLDPEEINFEKEIKRRIKKAFPDYSIFGEETGYETGDSGWTVYIDPICSSANFALRMQPFCTNIAFVEDGEIKSAYVVDYSRKERIMAVLDKKGIFINDRFYQKPKSLERKADRIHVDWGHSLEFEPNKRGIAKRLAKFMEKTVSQGGPWEMVNFSSSLSLVNVSLGKLDAFVGGAHNVYDLAAGAFLVRKSGGVVVNWDGKQWQVKNGEIIASRDKKTAEKILRLLRE